MVINMTLGRVTFDRVMLGRVTPDLGCGFACTGLVAEACPEAVHPAVRVMTTANRRVVKTENKRVDKKAKKRPNMRLLRRRLLLRAPRLLVCFRRESLGGQRLG